MVATDETIIFTPAELTARLDSSFGHLDRPILTVLSGDGNFNIAFREATADTEPVPDRLAFPAIVVKYRGWVFQGASNAADLDAYLQTYYANLVRKGPYEVREEPRYEDALQGR